MILVAEKSNGEDLKVLDLKRPLFPIQSVQDLRLQVVGNPNCKNPHCRGRGFDSVILDAKGSERIMFCECVRFKRTELMMVFEAVGLIAAQVDQMNSTFTEVLIRLEKEQKRNSDEVEAIKNYLQRPRFWTRALDRVKRFKERLTKGVLL